MHFNSEALSINLSFSPHSQVTNISEVEWQQSCFEWGFQLNSWHVHTGPICSRNSVWHRIPSKKRGSVHTDSLWFINRRKTHHSNKPDLSKLKLFTFSWPATADISELLLITLSLQFRAFLKCYMVSAWEDLSSKNQFKINTYRPTELKVLAYNQKYLTLTE